MAHSRSNVVELHSLFLRHPVSRRFKEKNMAGGGSLGSRALCGCCSWQPTDTSTFCGRLYTNSMNLDVLHQLYFLLCFVVPALKASPLCSLGQFACANGPKCIPRSWLCDGARDCPDGSDETHSQCHSHLSNTSCLGDQPECQHGGVHRCIPQDWLCDGHRDCDNGEDEMNCVRDVIQVLCGPNQHSCDKRCLNAARLCDRVRDCEDGSDEDERRCAGTTKNKVTNGPKKESTEDFGRVFVSNATKSIVVTASKTSTRTADRTETSTVPTNFSTSRMPLIASTASKRPGDLLQKYGFPVTSSANRTATSPSATLSRNSTTTPQPSTEVTFMKYLKYKVVEPVKLVEVSGSLRVTQDVSENATAPATTITPGNSSAVNLKAYSSNIRRMPEKLLNVLHKREAKMDNSTTEPMTEEKQHKAEQKASEDVPIQPVVEELPPVNSVVGVPIKPMNL